MEATKIPSMPCYQVPVNAAYVLQQREKPVAVVTRLRQIFRHMADAGQLATSEATRLDATVQNMNQCIMTTEPIRNPQHAHSATLFRAHWSITDGLSLLLAMGSARERSLDFRGDSRDDCDYGICHVRLLLNLHFPC
jgi:hypothetical protein